MSYSDDPLVAEMTRLLATAIRQAVERELGVSFEQEVKADAYGYIIGFEAKVPGQADALGPRRWAAEVRGSYDTLLDASRDMTADVIVGQNADVIIEMWRRDNPVAENGVNHASTISR